MHIMSLKVIHFAALFISVLVGFTQPQCISDNYVNGCSIPYGLDFYYKGDFTNACNRHDVCYYCGQKYGWTRSECDIAFKRDMERACTLLFSNRKRSFWNDIKASIHVASEIQKLATMSRSLEQCKQAAKVYYLSVNYFGKDNYVSQSPSWCNDPCARANGSPV